MTMSSERKVAALLSQATPIFLASIRSERPDFAWSIDGRCWKLCSLRVLFSRLNLEADVVATCWLAMRSIGQWFKIGKSSGHRHLLVMCSTTGSGDNSMAPSNDAQIAMEQGMMIAEVNVAIGAIDRILKMIKDGKSNNRELTNARVELDHWRARLLKAIHKG